MQRHTAARVGVLIEIAIASVSCRTAPMPSPNVIGAPGASAGTTQVRRSRDVLGFEEINAKGARTAYDAILLLRPEFLKPRSAPLATDELRSKRSADELLEERDGRFPTIFLNGAIQSGPAVLRTIRASVIIEIRYYPDGHVPAKYGIRSTGIIDVHATPSG